jgi:hypothetical protein
MVLNGFYQNAYVTRNRDKAVALLRERHGLGDFIFFETDIEVRTPGGIGRAQTKVALGWAGNLQIEVIEPISGLVDLYYPYLPDDDHSLGFHHVAMRVNDWGPFCEEIEREKYPVAYASGLEGLEFVYLDARATLGHYVEYMWATAEWWKALGYPGA